MNRALLITILASSAVFASRGVLEDFKCQIPQSVQVGKQTVVDCGTPGHGFDSGRATAFLSFTTAQHGDRITIGDESWRFVTSLWGCSPRDVLLTTDQVSGSPAPSTVNSVGILVAAINGDREGWVADTTGWKLVNLESTRCPGTNASAWVTAANSFSQTAPALQVRRKAGGPAGIGTPVVATGGLKWLQLDRKTPTDRLLPQWHVRVLGASGAWQQISAKVQLATYSTPSSYTIAFDSSQLPEPVAQSWVIRRAVADGHNFFYHNYGDAPGPIENYSNGTYSLYIPGCTTLDSDTGCSNAFMSPENQKGYGNRATITSFAVRDNIATVTLGGWRGDAYGYAPPQPGTRVFVRGFEKYAKAVPIVSVLTSTTYTVRIKAPAHGCSASDRVAIAGVAVPSGLNGSFSPTILDADTIEVSSPTRLPGWRGGGTVSCNPEGRPAQNEAGYFARSTLLQGVSKVPSILTHTGNTLTLRTALADGTYTPINGFVSIQPLNGAYLYLYPRSQPANSASFSPIDTTLYHLKSGDVDVSANRIRYWVKFGVNMMSKGSYSINRGTYPVSDHSPYSLKAHYYHYTSPNIYSDEWMLFEFNNAPDHQVGAGGGINWPTDPVLGHPHAPAWQGRAGTSPWSNLLGDTTSYLDLLVAEKYHADGGNPAPGFGKSSVFFGRIEVGAVPGEPEEWIRSRTAVFATRRFIGGQLVSNPGYEVGWGGMSYGPALRYEIRYSTSRSLRIDGWSAGLPGGLVAIQNQALGGKLALWQSPTMQRQTSVWVGIRPVMPILGASTTAGPLSLFFMGDPGMSAGDRVQIAGAGTQRGTEDAIITATLPRKTWFVDRPPDGTRTTWASGGGKLKSIVASSGLCTTSLSESHGLVQGALVEVHGTTGNWGPGAANYSGAKRYVVSTLLDSTRFTFACPGVSDGTYDSSAPGYRMSLQSYPGVTLSIASSGGWSGGGTMTSIEENRNFAEVQIAPFGDGTQLPPVFTGSPNVTELSPSSFRISWERPPSAEGSFFVERKKPGSANFESIGAVDGTQSQFVDESPVEWGEYQYRVRFESTTGETQVSPISGIQQVLAHAAPQAPSKFTISDFSDETISLGWAEVPNAEGFSLEVDWGAGFAEASRLTHDKSTATLQVPRVSGTCRFRLRAFNRNGMSPYSEVQSIALRQQPK